MTNQIKFGLKANIFLVHEVVLKTSNAQSLHYKSTFAKEDVITAYITQANKNLRGKKWSYYQATAM